MEKLKKLQEQDDAPSHPTVTPTLSGLRCEHEDAGTVVIPWRNIRTLQSKALILDSEFKTRLAEFPISRIAINGMRNFETFFRLKRRSCLQTFEKEGFAWTCVSEWKRSGPLIVFGVLAFAFGALITVKTAMNDWDDAFVGLNATQRECYTAVAYFCCYGMVATFWAIALACLFAVRHHLINYFPSDKIERVELRDSSLCFWFQSNRSIRIRLSDVAKITRAGLVCVNNHQTQTFAFRPTPFRDWAMFATSLQMQLDARKKYENAKSLNWARITRAVIWCTLLGCTYLAVDILAIVTEQNWLRLTTPALAACLLQTIGVGDYLFDYVFYAAKLKLGLRPQRSPRPFVVTHLKTAK